MIRHIVMWRLQTADPVGRVRDARTLRDAFAPLPGVIQGVRRIAVDANSVPADGNFDVALTVDLDDAAALARYQQHPAHLEVAALAKSLTRERAAIDYEA